MQRQYPTPEETKIRLLGLEDGELGAIAASTIPRTHKIDSYGGGLDNPPRESVAYGYTSPPTKRLRLVKDYPTSGEAALFQCRRAGRCGLCGHEAGLPCVCAGYGHEHQIRARLNSPPPRTHNSDSRNQACPPLTTPD